MDYALAKQLKDAGFVQFGEGAALVLQEQLPEGDQTMSVIMWRDFIRLNDKIVVDFMYAPTLEELIEACGDQFGSLGRDWLDDVGRFWCAIDRGREETVPPRIECTGATPAEAVAKLWLALNKL